MTSNPRVHVICSRGVFAPFKPALAAREGAAANDGRDKKNVSEEGFINIVYLSAQLAECRRTSLQWLPYLPLICYIPLRVLRHSGCSALG